MSGQTPEDFHIRLANRFEEIDRFTEGAHAFLLDRGVQEEMLFNVDLCFEEVFTNIVKYSFNDNVDHWIDAAAAVDQDGMVLCIEDDGRPFDPRVAAEPDLSTPIEDRPIGGLGLHLVRKIASRLDYETANGRNRLTIHLPCPAE